MNQVKKFFAVAAIGTVLSLCTAIPALAENLCSLEIEASESGSPLSEVEFRVYKIADMETLGEYQIVDVFQNAEVSLDANLSDAEWENVARDLVDYVQASGMEPYLSGSTDIDGMLRFENVPVGLYLVDGDATTVSDLEYTPQAFCVTLPKMDKDGSAIYAMRVSPTYEVHKLASPSAIAESLDDQERSLNEINSIAEPNQPGVPGFEPSANSESNPNQEPDISTMPSPEPLVTDVPETIEPDVSTMPSPEPLITEVPETTEPNISTMPSPEPLITDVPETTESVGETHRAPQTGDTAKVLFWIGVILLSGMLLLVLLMRLRKD